MTEQEQPRDELQRRLKEYEDTLRALARMDAKTKEGEAVKRVCEGVLKRHGKAPF